MKTAFIHTNLIDVLEGTLIPDCSVIVEDGIIVDIITGDPSDRDSAAVDSVVDLQGTYMTPGFFDCHVHIVNDALPEKLSPKKTVVGYTLT
ncbi:MAG: hypothetical protein IKK95_06430, partial [Lachnospiraceae bacterium]|nr:hypothetical protein [Lachnospiraceae bacterium]